MTSQLNRTVDQFLMLILQCVRNPKKLFLITAGNDRDDWVIEYLQHSYLTKTGKTKKAED